MNTRNDGPRLIAYTLVCAPSERTLVNSLTAWKDTLGTDPHRSLLHGFCAISLLLVAAALSVHPMRVVVCETFRLGGRHEGVSISLSTSLSG